MSDNPQQPGPVTPRRKVPSFQDWLAIVGMCSLVGGVLAEFGPGVALMVLGVMLLALAGVSFVAKRRARAGDD